MTFQIHHAKEAKQTSYCVIIYVNISELCICIYHNKACITPSNGTCNNKKKKKKHNLNTVQTLELKIYRNYAFGTTIKTSIQKKILCFG
jgi:hypothetical protein